MTTRQKVWTTIAGLHLLLVTYCASTLPLPQPTNPMGTGLRWYGTVSGAYNTYGFFKQVTTACKVSFLIYDQEGNMWSDTLNRAPNREASLRFKGSLYLLAEWNDTIAEQWAATMFGRYPKADQVTVVFETYDPGSMEDYRAGNRPDWVLSYAKGFLRRDRVPAQPEGE